MPLLESLVWITVDLVTFDKNVALVMHILLFYRPAFKIFF